jgi:hypothetical protein
MPSAPDDTATPVPDPRYARLVIELNKMRDALMELSLQMREYVYLVDSEQRSQAESQADQAIERAKASACQSPRRL